MLNGLVGDYLSRTHNGLATPMAVRHAAQTLPLETVSLAEALPHASPRLVLFVHGLMSTEAIWDMPDGSNYGSRLERDLGVTALHLRYNTGRTIAQNGDELSSLLQRLLRVYPVDIADLQLVGHSMGGLVIRSACHFAQLRGLGWLGRVQRAVYIGTPHLGAPSERLGKLVSTVLQRIPNPYTQLIGDLSELRSAGVKDLAHADLRPEDRAIARSPWSLKDARHPVPLLPGIDHHLIASSLFGANGLAGVLGDSLVPVASATFGGALEQASIPSDHIHMLPKLSHLALAHHPDVYAVLRAITEAPS